jgi:transcriptional regulatory protein LEU3
VLARLIVPRLISCIHLPRLSDIFSGLVELHVIAARLHLHAFYLFDTLTSRGYLERLITLIGTASQLLEHTQALDARQRPGSFVSHCPFSVYHSVVCAAFVLLKVLRSEYFADLMSQTLSTTLNLFLGSVNVLRRMSVSKNDLPGRLADVLEYLHNHPDPRVVCSPGKAAFELQVKSRGSMSIVYDSLWRWREQFIAIKKVAAESNGHPLERTASYTGMNGDGPRKLPHARIID